MPGYPRQRDIEKVLTAAKRAGIEVVGVECLADGTIRTLWADGPKQAENDDAGEAYRAWKKRDAARSVQGQV